MCGLKTYSPAVRTTPPTPAVCIPEQDELREGQGQVGGQLLPPAASRLQLHRAFFSNPVRLSLMRREGATELGESGKSWDLGASQHEHRGPGMGGTGDGT